MTIILALALVSADADHGPPIAWGEVPGMDRPAAVRKAVLRREVPPDVDVVVNAPTAYTAVDSYGRSWHHADPATLGRWVEAIELQRHATPVVRAWAAPRYSYAAGTCAGGSCSR